MAVRGVQPSPETAVGTHVLVDLWGVDAALLDDAEELGAILVEAAVAGGATVKGSRVERFEPHGVSGVVILAESHLAVHTWPEHGVAAADVFTCGPPAMCRRIADALVAALAPVEVRRRELARGVVAAPAEVVG